MDTATEGSPAAWSLSVAGQNWHKVLTQFRAHLQHICESELVAADHEAKRIIAGMVHCRTMTDVDAEMDRLIIRCGELLVAKTGDKTEFDRLLNRARAGGRAAFANNGKRHNFSADDEAP